MLRYILIIVLITLVNIINCTTTLTPTITAVTVLFSVDRTIPPTIQITGTNFLDGNDNIVKQIVFQNAVNKNVISFYTLNSTALTIFLLTLADQMNYLIDTNVYICGDQPECPSTQSNQMIPFIAPPLCNQLIWKVDAGAPTFTLNGVFPSTPSTPPSPSFITFSKGTTTYYAAITLVNSSQATVSLANITSGINYSITNFQMNGKQVVTRITQFSFNPPSITGIDCQNSSQCIIYGSSFGAPKNTPISINAYFGDQYQPQTVLSNNQSSITLTPGTLFRMVGSKTIILIVDGNQSSNYTFITSATITNKSWNNNNITINVSNGCDNAHIQFGDILTIPANVSNNIVTVAMPSSARSGNVTLLCNNAASDPFPIRLIPTLNYSTTSNTTGTIITIYGQFISPIDTYNQPLSILIKTSYDSTCFNATYVSAGVTTCVAPPGAGTATSISITIDGLLSPTTIPLIYNKPFITNYSLVNNNNTLYLSGYNFGDDTQPISATYNQFVVNVIHTIPHREIKIDLTQNLPATGKLELIVAGQSANSIDISIPKPINDTSSSSINKWLIPVIVIAGLIVLGVAVFIGYKIRSRYNKDEHVNKMIDDRLVALETQDAYPESMRSDYNKSHPKPRGPKPLPTTTTSTTSKKSTTNSQKKPNL